MNIKRYIYNRFFKKRRKFNIKNLSKKTGGLLALVKTVVLIVLGIIFFIPAVLVFCYAMDNDSKIRSEGGMEVEESLRENAVGGVCLLFFVAIIWSYCVCVGIILGILYLTVGMFADFWMCGFWLAIPLDIAICWLAAKLMCRADSSKRR